MTALAEVYIPLEEAALLEGIKYKGMTSRVERNPHNFTLLKQPQPNGGKPCVLIALPSLSPKAQKAYQKTQQINGGDAIVETRTRSPDPWYLDVDVHWYIENHSQQYYEAVELGTQIQKFIDYDENDRTGYSEDFARQLGLSQRSLYRYAERYMEAAAWSIRLEREDGHNYDYLKVLSLCRKPKESGTFPSLPPEQRALIENIWFDKNFAGNNGTVEMLYDTFETYALNQGWQYPSYQTVARYINHMMNEQGYRNAHKLQQKGLREYKRTVMIKGLRDTSEVPVMGIIQGDAHRFDFWVKYTDPTNGKVSAIRPSLAAWIDTRSRVVMGPLMAKDINAQIIKHSLLKVTYTYGLMECVLTDNGKEYTAKSITGRHRNERSDHQPLLVLDAEAKGFLKSLGVKDDYRSLPYQPWGKGQVERFFRTVCEQFSKWFLSYTGTLTGSRTAAKVEKDIDKLLAQDKLISLEECYELFVNYLEKYHNKKHRGLKDAKEIWQTPMSLFENAPEHYTRPAPPLEYAAMLLMKDERARVYKTGINRFGETFMVPELETHVDTLINIRWDPEDLTKLLCYTLDGKKICEAPQQLRLHFPGYSTQEEIAEHKRKQNGQLKRDRERIREKTTPYEARIGAPAVAGKLDYMIQNKNPQPVVALPEDKQYRDELKAKSSRRKRGGNEYFDRKAEEALETLRKLG